MESGIAVEASLDFSGSASWIEISAQAIRNNIEVFRRVSGGTFSLWAVLKGNAYGHGLRPVFSVVHDLVEGICVITPQDAFLMREIESQQSLSRKRILVLGALTCEEIVECARLDIEMVVADRSWVDAIPQLRSSGLCAQCYIHIDSGLSREGFPPGSLEKDLAFLKTATDVIHLKGAMSHFANTEDVTEQSYALLQVSTFEKAVKSLRKCLSLSESLDLHFSASAATLVLPPARFNSVRLGISIYGYWPSSETRISAKWVLKDLPNLAPALSWKCRSQVVKPIGKGTYVGYGCTYRCDRDSLIAVFPVGYFDGYPRVVSGKAYVLIRGRRCPVIGRVMMNHIIVDVTQVASNDTQLEATLIGTSGDETLSAETLAKWSDTIQYEIVTRLGAHLKRILIE